MRTLRRPLAMAAAVASATLALSGCSDTNFSAQTNQPYQPAVGANARGDINVLNTVLVANPDGTATLSAGVVNTTDTDDAISDVTATTLDGTSLRAEGPDEDTALPFKSLVRLGQTGEDSAYMFTDAPIGKYVRLTVTFTSNEAATIEAPVVTRGEIYEDIVD